MSDHGETILPLGIGLVLAVVLTLTGLAWTEPALTLTRDDADDWLARAERVKELRAEPVMEQRRRIRLGDDAPVRPTIAWLGAEAYDDLMARRADTDQAPSQQEVTPVEDAPMRVDATEPLPEPTEQADPEREPAPPTEVVEPQVKPEAEPAPPVPRVAPIPLADSDAPSPDALAALTPDDQPDPRDPVEATPVEQEPVAEAQPDAAPTPEPQPAAEPTPPSPSTPQATPDEQESAPTSSPDENRESDAAQQRPDEPQKVRPGRVVVQQGIKIETAHPRFGIATLYSALPTDPLVRVVFSPQGQVIRAEILESTGFSDVDGPILASLYKWKATGKELEKQKEPFDVEIRMRFGGE